MEKDSMNLLDYLRIFNRWKWRILLPAFLAFSIVAVIGLRSPRPYMAETTILLSGGGTFMVGGRNSVLGIPNLSTGNPNVDIVESMVLSRRMAGDIIDHFKLTEKGYGKNRTQLLRKVRRMINTSDMRNGVSIQVTTTDPQLSSDIANFCVSNLNKMNEELDLTTEKPVAKVLDPAIPPVLPSSRKILPRAFLAFLVCAAGIAAFCFFNEHLKELRRRETNADLLSENLRDKEKEEIFS